MGDPARFRAFADLIQEVVPKSHSIADVAGGKGKLKAELYRRGYLQVTSWDKRRRNAGRAGYVYGLFDWKSAPHYDAVVAMHPDGATDHTVLYATRRGVPTLVCPCCIVPSAMPYGGERTYDAWCEYLEGLATHRHTKVRWATLPITGRSRVLIIEPRWRVL